MPDPNDASVLIDLKMEELGDWRAELFTQLRALIHVADPDVVEELKWGGTPVFSHAGIICTGEIYKEWVKLTFAQGAFLKDPKKVFNSSLEGNLRRAVDFKQGAKVNGPALMKLVKDAVAYNEAEATAKKKPAATKPAASAKPTRRGEKPAAPATKPATKKKPAAKAKR
jgi:hypothetical protein